MPLWSAEFLKLQRLRFADFEQIITADVAPVLAATDSDETASDTFTAGTYSSTAGTIDTQTAVALINGIELPLGTNVVPGDTLAVRETVTDSAANQRIFTTVTVVVSPAVALGAGAVATLSGSPIVGQTITTNVAATWTGSYQSEIGTPPVTYQWQRDSVDIPGATFENYTIVAADDGAALRRVDTADDGFTQVSQNTAATATVTHVAPVATGALSDQLYQRNVAISSFDVSSDFTGQALTFALSPSSDALPTGLSLSSAGVITGTPTALSAGASIIIRATNSGGFDDSGFTLTVADVPEQMAAPSLTSGDTLLTVDLAEGTTDNNSAIIQEDIRYSTDESNWTTITDFTDGDDITGLTNDIEYFVQSRAVNAFGAGPWSSSASATVGITSSRDDVLALSPIILYDISDLDTLFADRSATPTTPASVDGVVGTILDLSGNGHHAIAPSDSARGILRQSGDLYYISTDSSDDGYLITGNFPTSTTLFIASAVEDAGGLNFMLVNHGGSPGGINPLIAIGSNGSSSPCNAGAGTPTTRIDQTALSAETRDALFDAIVTGAPHVMTVRDCVFSSSSGAALFSYLGSFKWEVDFYGLCCGSGNDIGDIETVETWLASLNGVSL